MKQIAELPSARVEPLYEIAYSAIEFSLIKTAIDFKVHDFFEKPGTALAFADKANTNSILTVKFLNALTAMGFLEKKGSEYTNTDLASAYLVSDKPLFQGDMLQLLHGNLAERWDNLGRALQNGHFEPAGGRQPFNKDFTTAVAQWALGGGVHRTVEIVSSLPEFKNARRLLDLGGGHGLYAIAFSQANPELESVVLDLPPVLQTTEATIAEYEMQGRVKTLPGDYVNDKWGGKYDFIFASDVFFRDRQDMVPVIRKIRYSLNERGVFISKHGRMDEGRTAPAAGVFHDLMLFLVRPFPPHTYTREEFVQLFQDAGFGVETQEIEVPWYPSEIVVCRKQGRDRMMLRPDNVGDQS